MPAVPPQIDPSPPAREADVPLVGKTIAGADDCIVAFEDGATDVVNDTELSTFLYAPICEETGTADRRAKVNTVSVEEF